MYALLRKMKSVLSFVATNIHTLAALATVLGIAVPAYLYVTERNLRERDSIYAAWQIVASMEGKKGSGGRETAIAHLKTHNEDLSGINLDNSILRNLDLSNIALRNMSFISSHIVQSTFNRSHLSVVDFSRAHLEEARFFKSTIELVYFDNAIIADANFDAAKFTRCRGNLLTSFNASTFRKATMVSSEFLDVNFDNVICNDCVIIDTTLSGSRWVRGKLERSSWHHVIGNSLDLSFTIADNIQIDRESELRGSKVEQASLKMAIFTKVNMANVNFFGSKLQGAKFVDSDLTGVDFTSSDLSNVKIERCQIDGAKFSGSVQSGLEVVDSSGKPEGLTLLGAVAH